MPLAKCLNRAQLEYRRKCRYGKKKAARLNTVRLRLILVGATGTPEAAELATGEQDLGFTRLRRAATSESDQVNRGPQVSGFAEKTEQESS